MQLCHLSAIWQNTIKRSVLGKNNINNFYILVAGTRGYVLFIGFLKTSFVVRMYFNTFKIY